MATITQGQQADPFGIYVAPGKTAEDAIAGGIFNTPQEAESAGYRFYYPPEAPKALDENQGNVSLDGTPVSGAATTTVPDWATSLLSNNPFDTTSQAYIDAKKARDAAIEANFLKRRGEIEAQSSREQGGVSAKFQTGSRTGIGYDSIKEAQINDIKKEAEKAIDNARRAMEEAKINGDETALNNSLKQFQLAMDIKNQATNEALAQAKLKLDALTMSTNLPKGTTFELGGVTYEGLATPESFFKSRDIIDLMKATPEGQTKTITDPTTGTTYTIQGVASPDDNLKQFTATDNAGNFSIINFDPATGQVVNQAKIAGVGKTGGSGTSVTLSMNQAQVQDLTDSYNKLNSRRGDDGLFDTNIIQQEYEKYSKENPGKASQFLDMVKGSVNYNDQIIKDLYGKKTSNNGSIKMTNSSGQTIEID